jgi:hypothetical protein
MEIIGRNPNPDRYTIKDIRIDWEHSRFREKADGTKTPLVDVYLLVDLEPKPYLRVKPLAAICGEIPVYGTAGLGAGGLASREDDERGRPTQ